MVGSRTIALFDVLETLDELSRKISALFQLMVHQRMQSVSSTMLRNVLKAVLIVQSFLYVSCLDAVYEQTRV